MTFHPQGTAIPSELRTEEFILRPLLTTDVELDYDAVMSSKEMLRVWEQTDWPVDDFTLEDNLEDLERHEREHLEGIAFTFTVMNPSETECLGCVYIRPLKEQLRRIGVAEVDLGDVQDTEAFACFWVRLSRLVDGLEGQVLDALINWFEQNWAFTRVVFGTNSQDERQVRLFEEKGFRRLYIHNYPDRDVQHLIYG